MLNQTNNLIDQAVAGNQQMVNDIFNRQVVDQQITQAQNSSLLRYAACNNWDEVVAVSQDEACLGKYTNLAGAVIGVGLSVAIELTRENGNAITAGVAAGVGASLIVANREAIMGFQNGPASVIGGLGLLGLTQGAARIAGVFTSNEVKEVSAE